MVHIKALHRFSCCGGCGKKYFVANCLLEELKQDRLLQAYVYYDTKKHDAIIQNFEFLNMIDLVLHVGIVNPEYCFETNKSKVLEFLNETVLERIRKCSESLKLSFEFEPLFEKIGKPKILLKWNKK
jgi:hypothetical protein